MIVHPFFVLLGTASLFAVSLWGGLWLLNRWLGGRGYLQLKGRGKR